ncbi:metallophosphoesterase family protein [Aquihabitans sp. G128]|uniref:metallophosphoesterase family protein n=1 Tax=Aquihabitans sp. G128 TaxID=2849779 RepID=UPI001C22C3D9|nr:metallophosphoesterase [Aquihabitans sp. G128]QXC63250.1 metallophosphoesterase family protein [Aquihabitans sp. G128]
MTAAPRPSISVFAVEDTTVQLTWRGLAAGRLRLQALDTASVVELDVAAGPGAAVLAGLPPGRALTIAASGPALGGAVRRLRARTLPTLPGQELHRLATIGDLHLGTHVFGQQGTIREEPEPEVAHPIRCATAAIDDAVAWGAERLVGKGDLTNHGQVPEWRRYAALVEACPVPVDAVPGNHDRAFRRSTAGLLPDAASVAFGLSMAQPVLVRDVPGARLVLVDSTTDHYNRGRVSPAAEAAVQAAAEADPDRAVLVFLHHQLQAHPFSEGWPIGVSQAESLAFLEDLGRAHRHVLVSSGHTHRHRRWEHAGVTTTQVGSTKDFPGVWAGYVVAEGGLRQVVRRVARPDCLAWTDHTRRAALGVWRWVSPGLLSSRCFDLTWA